MSSYLQASGRIAAKRAGASAPLARMTVRARPGNHRQGLMNVAGRVIRCALGRSGIAALKREGDGATPLGRMALVSGYVRHRRFASGGSGLALATIRARDGWCDAPGDPNYNRPVGLPYRASAESMMRSDHLYDCCIVLDYNLRPRRRGAGSAIFLHVAKPGYAPTEGCVAVSPADMRLILPRLSRRTVLVVTR